MEDAAALIEALAALVGAILWPLVVLLAFWLYKPEFVGLLRRLRKVRLPGLGAEFDQELDELEQAATQAETTTAPSPANQTGRVTSGIRVGISTSGSVATTASTDAPGATESSEIVLAEARQSPKLALITLAALIEREARFVLASSADPRNWLGRSLGHMVNRLNLSPATQEAVDEFRRVRNRIIHGGGAGEDEIIRALDSGLKILRAIENIPRTVHVVYHPRVEVFGDSEGNQPRPVHAVVLESRSPADEPKRMVYPTPVETYERGKAVSWEWSFERTWPESWYRDPEDGQIKYGWTDSAEFVGRHLEDLVDATP
jgi:hypothetical protein